MLSRKYYEMLADTLANHVHRKYVSELVHDLCLELKRDNRRFDRQKFEDRIYKQIGYPSTR